MEPPWSLDVGAWSFGLVHFVACTNTAFEVKLWPMKLRTDLLKKLTPEMLKESVTMNTLRYKPEPLLSTTGTGSLSSASTSDSAAEVARSTARLQKLMRAAKANGGKAARRNGRSSKR